MADKQPTATNEQVNAYMLARIWQAGVERLQPISSASYNPANQSNVTINPQNVGLVRGFLVKFNGTITNTNATSSGVALTRTEFGASNILRNFTFTDTNNQVRHQTQGWHIGLVNSAKQPMVMGAAYSPNVPVNYGNNWTVQSAASSVAAAADAAVQFYYYIPLSYGRYDLRGAMWAGVTNAVAQLQFEINPTPVVQTGDASLAVYSGNTGGWKTGTTVTISVWQDYIDQIDMVVMNGAMQPAIPADLLQTLYCLNNTTLTGLTANQDFGIPYGNWRQFLSTAVVYNNAGVLNAGSDVNYFNLQTANTSQLWKFGPNEAALFARSIFLADPPKGAYWFDSRRKPIDTQQFGNMQLTLNPSAVTTGASVWVGWEYFTQANKVTGAQSLPTGG